MERGRGGGEGVPLSLSVPPMMTDGLPEILEQNKYEYRKEFMQYRRFY